ncbi:MAG: transglutaminase-like domain-containing protein [Bacteroidota bacterium]|nr:transglutaminase-like domain-containing protein [Bacteroidota bacterium]MDP4197409.1 transglutaminase-like domain-containing protein [Bacteroidota bacterium]
MKIKTLSLLLLLTLLLSQFVYSQEHFLSDPAYRQKIQEQFLKQKKLAHNRSNQLFSVFDKEKLSLRESEALKFLYASMPLSDLADYKGEFYLNSVRLAFKAKDFFPWGKQIPEDIFRHFVLPVRINNENLDSSRAVFFEALKDRLKGMSMREAALEVNHWCHEKVTYKSTDGRTISPLGAVKSTFGRCGEETTFSVSALRAAGIPARQCYTPRWAHMDDNHAWVEVWIDGKWYYLGGCEPEADLNMAWFTEFARRAMLVHTKAFGNYMGNEEVVNREEHFATLNLLDHYSTTKTVSVKVTDELNKPVKDASVSFRLYNYAEFYTLAELKTDSKGLCSFKTGLGTLMIWVKKNGRFAYKRMYVPSEDTLIVKLNKKENFPDKIEDYDLIVPEKPEPFKTSENGRQENSLRLVKEDQIRNQFAATFIDSVSIKTLAEQTGLDNDSLRNFVKLSFGNWPVITDFIKNVAPEKRKYALSLLSGLSLKDYRDVAEGVLFDNINNIPEVSEQDQAIFAKYVLSPRISNEMLTDYKGYFRQKFSGEFIKNAKKDISTVINWIKQNIKIEDKANYYSTPLTPKGVYDLRVSDKHSRDIFFVALCRSFGIPSQIDYATGIPQYYLKGNWKDVEFEKRDAQSNGKTGIVILNNTSSANLKPEYYINYTIAKYNDDGDYKTLDYEISPEAVEAGKEIYLRPGKYLLVTGKRKDDGSVLSRLNFFTLKENEKKLVNLQIRSNEYSLQAIGKVNPEEKVILENQQQVTLSSLASLGQALLIWADTDLEPTKHLIADLQQLKTDYELSKVKIVFICSKKKEDNYNYSELKTILPEQTLFSFDQNIPVRDLFKTSVKNSAASQLPVVALFNNDGEVLYYSEGYKIGNGREVLDRIKQIQSSCKIK